MIKYIFLFLSIFLLTAATAQKKPFYKEDFSGGKIPDGWYIPKVGNWDPQWIVTNQPYPGSYKYQQQAPPIASKSRGYHLQFQAGYFTDEDVESWVKKKNYPDGYIISAPINCADKKSVVLKFQQTFRWWDYAKHDTAGLFVGISTDSIHWQEWDVRSNIKSATDMVSPLKQEINISKWAANQPKIFIRFYWKGMQAWYWMVDDIELYEADAKDIGIVQLLSHSENKNTFTANDKLTIKIKNYGAQDITGKVTVNATIDGKAIAAQIIDADKKAIKSEEEMEVVFPNINLAGLPIHKLSFTVTAAGDETPENNNLSQTISNEYAVLGNITKWQYTPAGIELQSGVSKLKILFYQDDIFRIWLSPDGNFTNPAGNDIVLNPDIKPIAVVNKKVTVATLKVYEDAQNIYISTAACKLQIQKSPIQFSLFDNKGKNIWREKSPLSFGAVTEQKLIRKNDEYFYGCGMQNGYFSHRDKDVLIEKGGGWDDGGRANPVPFYMSNAGYGVLRNTYDAGKYSFKETVNLSHNENRFDAFYFCGPSLKNILNQYTTITGRPFLMPRWALSMGDANCYNKEDRKKQPQTTPAVITTVADKYIENNMPRGWILPNDGYGCGYTRLDSVVKELGKRGFKTGLWTENGVDKIATEVGTYGTRLCKLDVAWVGPGYKYALDGCKAAYEGIEKNSHERGFVWSVMGWAGTHRYSTVWTGDQSGNWEYIRFHIPTIIGSGLTAQNAATGDVDGIFGGSDSTYTRDLQWKCFTPVFMVMSGWAKKDKQPYISGEPYTSINRKYLQLKMRLTPYMYTYCNEAYETGVPASRGMVLEYPEDKITWGTKTQYQFMNGEYLLVAPVYKSEGKRDSIYLPKGKWYDYWNGKEYSGNKWLNNYDAPLEKLPLFVKAGAVIPMYPQMNYDGEKRADTLTLEIYPSKKSSFNLYEDDGLTREHRKGAFAKTLIEVNAAKNIGVKINAAKGKYKGMYQKRVYLLEVHTKLPAAVLVNNKPIKYFSSKEIFDKAATGYYYDANEKEGTLHVKTNYLSASSAQNIQLFF